MSKINQKAEIVDVTPEMAATWLGKNHEKNRKMRPHKVLEYETEIRAGRWVLGDQAISFDVDDNLINGQHRLKAVFNSGITCRFLVLWGCPNRALYVIDGGMKRTTDDRLGMAGVDSPLGIGPVVRRIYQGMSETRADRQVSDWQIEQFLQEQGYGVAIRNIFTISAKHGQKNSTLRAVLFRARIKRHTLESLERFCEVLNTGIMQKGEDGAVVLRNYISRMNSRVGGTSSTGTMRRKFYKMIEACLWSYLNSEPITNRANPATVELFPMPFDKKTEETTK